MAQTRQAYIYALLDPISNKIRYIGCTSQDVNVRLKQHLKDRRKSHKVNWINKLKKKNLIPKIYIIEKVSKSNMFDREVFWINFYRSKTKLTNATNGGEGVVGYIFSKKQKTIISRNTKKALKCPNIRKKISQAGVGRTPVNRKKIIDNFGNIYQSITIASNKINVTPSAITFAIKNKTYVKNKYCFKYYNGTEKKCPNFNKKQHKLTGRSIPNKVIKKLQKTKLCKKIIDENGKEYFSISEASRVTKFSRRTICRCLKNKEDGRFFYADEAS